MTSSRLTEIKLPLDHADADLPKAIAKRLGIEPAELLDFHIHRRAVDARKPGPTWFIYTVDVNLADTARVRERVAKAKNVAPTPDMAYRFVAKAPEGFASRPVVVGTGP